MVAVQFGMIRKWSELLRYRMMWHGCVAKQLCWWFVRSSDKILIVYRGMQNGTRVADDLSIKRVFSVLEGFVFFSLHSFS